MSSLAERIEMPHYPAQQQEWAPFRSASSDDEGRVRSRLGGLGVLVAILIFSGVTVAVTRGQADLVERFGISEESLTVAAWMIQGATALFCFVLAVRWLRN